ncbi:MAG: (2Fe-2S)-binding protein [Alphaproteobacteria bacterium]|nr:(2Fe-2S)-binding protein [Alphaproteobacteria bacterium]MBF0374788.1 (2Fe-2S)-binding protein [Alphaproteobacteria bacterium]
MSVCLCHGLNTRDVKDAVAQGARDAGEVFDHFLVKPRCGRCVGTMCDMVAAECDRDGAPMMVAAE